MELATAVGMQLAVGIPGLEAAPEVIEALRRAHAQCLVVFTRNLESPEQFTALMHGLQEGLGLRLFVMVDHEGGRIMRFPPLDAIIHFPEALVMAQTHAPDQIERQGRTEAEELRQFGIHANLAPCVDVLVEGADPVIGDRSYGSDPKAVADYSVARIHGLQSQRVAACAKHFPGLGAVPRDPHVKLPSISLDWAAMEASHLVPFRAAITAGVAMIMSSHVCYPGLGEPEGLPATFSPHLIDGLLRKRMGYPGVIVSDALEMGALSTFGSIGERAVRAIEAGHDQVLICLPELAAAEEAAQALLFAYETGRLSEQRLAESVARITGMRHTYLA